MSTMREVSDNSTMQEISLTRPENLKWSYELLDNFLTCGTCYKQYTGSTEEFLPWFKNQRCVQRKFLKDKKFK